MKAQLLVHALTRQIICTATGRGAIHDFMLFKQSRTYVHPETQIKADAGYQGIQQGHALTQTPKKASKHHPLMPAEKAANRQLARERLPVEHVIRFIKIFRILKGTYRHRRRRFQLRLTLLCALYNHTQALPK
ncbi:transposase family protein [Deinococcus cavernae]|uniref:transposase family protein n=1 Tax=Deinococcus cavernae TaxID=2320857 RepID=UPI003083614D